MSREAFGVAALGALLLGSALIAASRHFNGQDIVTCGRKNLDGFALEIRRFNQSSFFIQSIGRNGTGVALSVQKAEKLPFMGQIVAV